MRVLLAEDTKELANALTMVLTHNKYAVDAVDNGTDALECALSGIFDIILLDSFADMLRQVFPGCDIQIRLNRGLCCYYAEEGGVLVSFEV